MCVKRVHKRVREKNLMVAVAASEEKNLLFSVFLRVQNVIAEPQSMNQQKEIEEKKKENQKEEYAKGTNHSRQNFMALILATMRKE